jgi:PAS domain S-box-containing protein
MDLLDWFQRAPRLLRPPPKTGDDESDRRAFTIHVISLAIIPAALLGLILVWSPGDYGAILPLSAGILVVAGGYWLNRSGKARIAGFLLVLVMLLVVTALLIRGQGVHDISITLYPATMILISLVMEKRHRVWGHISIFISLAFVVFGEVLGFAIPQGRSTLANWEDFVIIAAILGVIGVSMGMIERYLSGSLKQARQSAEALQASEARYRSLAENAPNLILHINPQGTIIYSNEYNLEPGDGLVGNSIYHFLLPEDVETVCGLVDQVFRSGKPVVYQVRTVNDTGRQSWYEFRLGPVWEDDRVVSMVAIGDNINARKASELALEQRTEQLAALNRIAQAVSSLQPLDGLLHTILEQLKQALPVEGFFVGLYNPEKNALFFPLMYDGGAFYAEAERPLVPGTLLHQCAHDGKSILENRTQEQIDHSPRTDLVGDTSRVSASVLMTPLPLGERTLGIVSISSYSLNAYTPEHLALLQGAASQIAIAVENARLYDAQQSELAERTRSEAALRQSEARIRAIIENIPYDLWMCDQDGVYVIQSSVSVHLAGNLLGKTLQDVPMPEGVKATWAAQHRRALAGEIVMEEGAWELYGKPHHFLTMLAPVMDGEAFIGFVGLNIDITEIKRSEETLRSYIGRIEILHEIDQAILAVRSPQEIAMAALSQLPRLMPCDAASLALIDDLGETARVLAWFADGKTLAGASQAVPVDDPERVSQLRLGQVLYVNDLVTEPLDQQSSLTRVLLVGKIHSLIAVPLRFRDRLVGVLSVGAARQHELTKEHVKITQEVAAQLAVALTQAQLNARVQELNTELEGRVSQRTAELEAAYKELEAFSYSVSHDLRAPLRGVMGYLSMFMEDYGQQMDANAQEYLAGIQSSGQRMGRLIDEILALSKVGRQTLHSVRVSLHAVFQEVLEELLVDKDRTRIQATVMALPDVEGDRDLLRQVCQNLVDNALKFSRNQPVSIIEIGSLLQDGKSVFYVQDNGVGFDMRYAERLFTPFQRLHSQDEFEGTGVGLAIVQRILTRHGGQIWVDSSPGEGTTFYFTLAGR